MDVKLSWEVQLNLGHYSIKLACNHSNTYLSLNNEIWFLWKLPGTQFVFNTIFNSLTYSFSIASTIEKLSNCQSKAGLVMDTIKDYNWWKDVKLMWDFQQNLGHSSLKLAYIPLIIQIHT